MFVRREFTFSAAHRIDLGGGKSEGLHGHNYGLVVTV
ncbi:MAG: 6-carboxytetrahydropterin synthase QueD, partial [Candidatus Hydrothermota bacterium]